LIDTASIIFFHRPIDICNSQKKESKNCNMVVRKNEVKFPMLTDRPNILATLRRNAHGIFEQILTPVQYHMESMLTIVPNHSGVCVVLGLFDDSDPVLSRLLHELGSKH
jgi:hypothetical protein